MVRALEQQDAIQDDFKHDDYGDTVPLTRAKTTPGDSPRPESDGPKGLNRQFTGFTGTTLIEPARNLSPELTPSISEEDGSEHGGQAPNEPRTHRKSTSSAGSRQSPRVNVMRDWRAHPPSPVRSVNDARDVLRPYSTPRGTALPIEEESGVSEAVEAAIKELYKIRQKEQSAKPLRIRPRESLHTPIESLKNHFLSLSQEEMEYRRLNTRDWLRTGTWWLLKVFLSYRLSVSRLINLLGQVSP